MANNKVCLYARTIMIFLVFRIKSPQAKVLELGIQTSTMKYFNSSRVFWDTLYCFGNSIPLVWDFQNKMLCDKPQGDSAKSHWPTFQISKQNWPSEVREQLNRIFNCQEHFNAFFLSIVFFWADANDVVSAKTRRQIYFSTIPNSAYGSAHCI